MKSQLHLVPSAPKLRLAILYCRFSSKMQNGKSLDEQEHAMRERARADGVRIVRVENDAAKSGKSLVGRDGLERAVSAIERGEATELWFWDTDRVARDESDYFGVVWKRVIDGAGGRVLDMAGFDSARDEARLLGGIKAIIAAVERRKIGARTARGIDGRIRAGYWHGFTPYGYKRERLADERGFPATKLTLDPERSSVVVRIFDLALSVGFKEIARRLNSEAVPSPLGSPWKGGTVAKMVMRMPVYLGNPQGVVREDLRIVSDELAAKVRSVVGARNHASGARRGGRFGPGPHASGRGEHLLTGWVKCPACGAAMRAYRSGKNRRYQCSSHMTGGTCANRVSANTAMADARVIEAIRTRVLSPEALAYARAKLENDASSSERKTRSAKAKLAQERATVEGALKRWVQVVESGGNVETAVVRIRELEARRAEIDAELQRPAEAREAAVALHPTTVEKSVAEALPLLASDPKRARPLLAALLGEPKLELMQADKGRHRAYYRAHFTAHPAAIALAAGVSHRVTRWT